MAISKLVLNGTEYNVGMEASYNYEGRELEEFTWDDLKQMCADGKFPDIRVGDYKTITMGGETVVMEIAGIDTYYNVGGPEAHGEFSAADLAPIPHHIDFISRDCLKTTYKWNETATNAGTTNGSADDGTDQPYLVSAVKKSLDGLVASLPTEVQSVIIGKNSLLERRAKQDTPLTDSTGFHWYNMGKLWLPSEYEVFGAHIWSTKGYGQAGAAQYPIFANSWKHRIKGQGNGGARCYWWLCSAYSGNATTCCGVSDDGGAGYIAATTSRGVPVCFRVAATTKLG